MDNATPIIIGQLAEVRRSGMANMMAIGDVRNAAVEHGFAELIAFCDRTYAMESEEAATTWIAALIEMGEMR